MKTLKNSFVLVILGLVLLTLQSYSCEVMTGESGPLTTEERSVSGFNEIEVSGGIDVYLTMDSEEAIKVEANENSMKHIVTEVRGSTLKIYFDKSFNWGKEAKVYVKAKSITKLSASGGSDVMSDNKIKAGDLVLNASGGSDLKVVVEVNSLSVRISGGSDLNISGSADKLDAESSGGSDLKGYDLLTKEAYLHASGGSDIQIFVDEKLDAHASGGSDVYYKGDPDIVKVESSSSSDIVRKN